MDLPLFPTVDVPAPVDYTNEAPDRLSNRVHTVMFGRWLEDEPIVSYITAVFNRYCPFRPKGTEYFYDGTMTQEDVAHGLIEKILDIVSWEYDYNYLFLVQLQKPQFEFWGLEIGYCAPSDRWYVQGLTKEEWDKICLS